MSSQFHDHSNYSTSRPRLSTPECLEVPGFFDIKTDELKGNDDTLLMNAQAEATRLKAEMQKLEGDTNYGQRKESLSVLTSDCIMAGEKVGICMNKDNTRTFFRHLSADVPRNVAARERQAEKNRLLCQSLAQSIADTAQECLRRRREWPDQTNDRTMQPQLLDYSSASAPQSPMQSSSYSTQPSRSARQTARTSRTRSERPVRASTISNRHGIVPNRDHRDEFANLAFCFDPSKGNRETLMQAKWHAEVHGHELKALENSTDYQKRRMELREQATRCLTVGEEVGITLTFEDKGRVLGLLNHYMPASDGKRKEQADRHSEVWQSVARQIADIAGHYAKECAAQTIQDTLPQLAITGQDPGHATIHQGSSSSPQERNVPDHSRYGTSWQAVPHTHLYGPTPSSSESPRQPSRDPFQSPPFHDCSHLCQQNQPGMSVDCGDGSPGLFTYSQSGARAPDYGPSRQAVSFAPVSSPTIPTLEPPYPPRTTAFQGAALQDNSQSYRQNYPSSLVNYGGSTSRHFNYPQSWGPSYRPTSHMAANDVPQNPESTQHPWQDSSTVQDYHPVAVTHNRLRGADGSLYTDHSSRDLRMSHGLAEVPPEDQLMNSQSDFTEDV